MGSKIACNSCQVIIALIRPVGHLDQSAWDGQRKNDRVSKCKKYLILIVVTKEITWKELHATLGPKNDCTVHDFNIRIIYILCNFNQNCYIYLTLFSVGFWNCVSLEIT